MRFKFLTSIPFLLMTMVLIVVFFGNYFPLPFKEVALAVSMLCKELIIFLLPLIIFSFVLYGLTELQSESFRVVAILIPLVCLSNFAGFWTSYLLATPVLSNSSLKITEISRDNILNPAFVIQFPTIVKNDWALLSAIIIAFFNNFIKSPYITLFGKVASVFANILLKRVVCRILPFFIFGFVIKMQYEGCLTLIIKDYSVILCLVAVLAYGYIAFVSLALCKFNVREAFTKCKNLVESVFIGLVSMSSAAAIPSTITASEKNLEDPKIARFVVPAVANMHLLGDCFAIPIIACAMIISFGMHYPTPSEYLIISIKGVIAKFAAAGIPGGSALVFAPILIDNCGFSTEMVTAFITVYLLFDPIATSSNVFGHGMFAMLFEKVYKLVKRH